MVRIVLMIGMAAVFVQDLRFRAVYWFTYPLLLAALLADVVPQRSWSEGWRYSGINLAFLLVQFLLLTVYFSLKHGQLIAITKGYLGWGDILLLVCLACYFPPLLFFSFYFTSLLIVLLFAAVYRSLHPEAPSKIPLAGLQALLFIPLLGTSSLLNWNLFNDDLLLDRLTAWMI